MDMKMKGKATFSVSQMQNNNEVIQISGFPLSSLPSGLIVEVLVRLSAKSIVMCKSVCKTWNTLISDPHFSKLHLARGKVCPLVRPSSHFAISRSLSLLEDEDGDGFFSGCCCCNFDNEKCELCRANTLVKTQLKIPLRNLDVVLSNLDSDDDGTGTMFCSEGMRKRKHWIKLRPAMDHRYSVVNSCNGLLCLCGPMMGRDISPIVVCNPITGEFVDLPEGFHEYVDSDFLISVCGLGYSPNSDQYKVITSFSLRARVRSTLSDTIITKVKVHTLGTNSWRSVGISSFKPGFLSHPTYLDGALHWIFESSDEDLTCVVSFEMEEERFSFHSLPSTLREHGSLGTGVLGGRLCVFTSFARDCIDIWTRNVDGVSESWTSIISFHMPDTLLRTFVKLVSSFDNGDLLLFCGSSPTQLIYYDRRRGLRFKHFKIDSPYAEFEAIAYSPSFISLRDIVRAGNGEVLDIYARCGKLKLAEETFPLLLCGGELEHFSVEWLQSF